MKEQTRTVPTERPDAAAKISIEGAVGVLWSPTMSIRTILAPEGDFHHIEQQWVSETGETTWRPIEVVRQSLIRRPYP